MCIKSDDLISLFAFFKVHLWGLALQKYLNCFKTLGQKELPKVS